MIEAPTEFPDSRMQRFASFGARAIWQLRDGQLSGSLHIEAGEFASAEDLQVLPCDRRSGCRGWDGSPGRPTACCWSDFVSGYSVFAEFHPVFDSWEDAERWVLGDDAVQACDHNRYGTCRYH